MEHLSGGGTPARGVQSGTVAVAIMAKAPWPGAVKTRLCPPLGAAQAAALYRCFLLDKIAEVRALVNTSPVIAYSPEEARREFTALAPDFSLVPQRGPDLGARLHATLAGLLGDGHVGAIAVDSDTPTLPREFLQQAVDCLCRREADVVLGPTEDGGYYLIGLEAPQALLFEAVPWSTSAVLDITLRKATAAGLRTVRLPTWFDIDTPDDLLRLERALDGGESGAAGQTGRMLASWRR